MTFRIYDGMAAQRSALIAAAWLAAILIVIAIFHTRTAAFGWLIGFTFWAQILIGSLTLVMIHRLTAGRWGVIIAPSLERAVAAMPLLLAFAIPLFIAIPVLYAWPHHPDSVKPDVYSYYLNTPWFIVRSLIALAGWSALALVLPRVGRRRGQLLSALGLVFHALVISSVSIDWYLSLEAPFTSSSFGASVAVSALVGALAWSILAAPLPESDPAIGDLGGLLLATILGITYIDFMAVLVIWYGDLPHEEIWFVERGRLLWIAFAWAAFLLASFFPVLALLLAKIRNARLPLRAVSGCVLAGLVCYDIYLVAPPSGGAAAIAGLIAIASIGLAFVSLSAGGIALLSSREAADAP